jgi:4-hydroxybenzoate polyprenyltransferase
MRVPHFSGVPATDSQWLFRRFGPLGIRKVGLVNLTAIDRTAAFDSTRWREILEVVQVARPGLWPTQLWFFLLPMAGQDVFGSASFWVGAIYVCFPLGLLLYGWNDVGDADTDRNNPRKKSWLFGGRPNESLRRRLPWIIASVQLPFVIAFVALAGAKMLLWFAAVLVSNAAYNTLGWKRLPLLDMVSQVGYLLIFVLASWLCRLELLSVPVMIFGGLFAMHSHLFAELMDLDEDRRAGRRCTAIVLGPTATKRLLSLMMWIEAAIAAVYFQGSVVALFMASGATFFLFDAAWGPPRYSLRFMRAFFVAWNVLVVGTLYLVWRDGWFTLAS